MTATLIHAIDLLLWTVMAVSVAYVAFFAFASLLRKRALQAPATTGRLNRFVVFYPAYQEDRVIRHSVETFLQQDYPKDHFQLVVISDHMEPATNEWLARQPLTLVQPVFEKSSKAKALQYAMGAVEGGKDFVVILDADNVVAPDFLSRLNELCNRGYTAIQCHRTAKNSDNDIALLDGVSEEINNSLFRRAHNRIGLSSALIGSGMCFGYEWFRANVQQLSTAGEDRELEALLLRQRKYVHYAEDIYVMDEKVSTGDNFQRQRLRWMTAQVQCLLAMLPYLPKALATGNIDYVDKTLQQALIPRSILLVLTAVFALFSTLLAVATSVLSPLAALKWWCLLLVLLLALAVAIPRQLRSRTLVGKALLVPRLAGHMIANVVRIDKNSKDFIHTTHNQ